jgi:hypothetical protein
MAAVKRQNADLTRAVAKQHELLRQQLNFDRRGFWFHFFAERHRPPVTPKHFAGRLAGTDSSQEFIFFFCQHGTNPFLLFVVCLNAKLDPHDIPM